MAFLCPLVFSPIVNKALSQALKGVRFAFSPAFRPQYIAKTSLKSGVFPVLATYSRHSFCTCSSSYSWLILGVTTYTLEYWKHGVRAHLHQAKGKRKQKFPLMFVAFSLIFFAFASAFAWCERAIKVNSHRAKVKIFFDVCCFFFDLFRFCFYLTGQVKAHLHVPSQCLCPSPFYLQWQTEWVADVLCPSPSPSPLTQC